MCYELFKNGVLVYSDCQDLSASNVSTHTTNATNTTNTTNTTTSRNSTLPHNQTTTWENNASHVAYNNTRKQSALLPSNATANTTVHQRSNWSGGGDCWPAPGPCACNNDSAVGIINESVFAVNDTAQNATIVTVVHSDAKARSPASHEWWIVVILCLCLFALFVLRAYSVHLRTRLAFMRGRSVAPDTRLKDVVPTAYPEEPPPTPSSSASVGSNITSATERAIAKKKKPALKHNSYKVNAARS